MFGLPSPGRLSTTRMSMTRRRSSFRSQGSAGPAAKDTRMVISRDDFVENYPQLLLEVTMDADSIMGELDADGDDTDWQYPGVDICFKDASLNIQIGEKTIKVVDEVTGRIRAKTMTALMGGSGAGKAILA
jgi:ABC-type glutathione transport system ATPase component